MIRIQLEVEFLPALNGVPLPTAFNHQPPIVLVNEILLKGAKTEVIHPATRLALNKAELCINQAVGAVIRECFPHFPQEYMAIDKEQLKR